MGRIGRLIGSTIGSVAARLSVRGLANDMMKASHLPSFSGSRGVFRHLAEAHIKHPEVGKAVWALVEVHGLDRVIVQSISGTLYQKAFK